MENVETNKIVAALSPKLQAFKGAARRAKNSIMKKFGRSTSSTIDNRPQMPLPTTEEIQMCIDSQNHEYHYPDLTRLGYLPPLPDVSTLPRKKEKSQKDFDLHHSKSLPSRSANNKHRRFRLSASLKAKAIEEEEEYIYPQPSPGVPFDPRVNFHQLKKHMNENSPPFTGFQVNDQTFSSPQPSNIDCKLGKTYSGRWRPPEVSNLKDDDIVQLRSPSFRNIDENSVYLPMDSTIYEPMSKDMTSGQMRPVGKVVAQVHPYSKETNYCYQTNASVSSFEELSVSELVECFTKCGLPELAELCQKERLDGQFFEDLTPEELREELNLTPFQLMKLKKIKRGWRPLTTAIL